MIVLSHVRSDLCLDRAAWERQRAKPKGLTEAEVKDRPPNDPALACPACGKLLKDAVRTPCCKKLYCEDCIHAHLLDNGFECPSCKTRIASLDKLKIDSEIRAKVREYVRTTVEESRKEAEDQSGSKSVSLLPCTSFAFASSMSSVVADDAMQFLVVVQDDHIFSFVITVSNDFICRLPRRN